MVKAKNLIGATQDTGAFVQLLGRLKRVATKLSKTCNDLRLLSSGPQARFGDIKLPASQADSSIITGKVNPVIPALNQVAFEVLGNDITATMASEAAQLQLKAFEPIMGWSMFKSIQHLSSACLTLQHNCVAGVEPDYALIVRTAIKTSQPIDEVAESLGIMTRQQMEALLVPEKLTQPLNSSQL